MSFNKQSNQTKPNDIKGEHQMSDYIAPDPRHAVRAQKGTGRAGTGGAVAGLRRGNRTWSTRFLERPRNLKACWARSMSPVTREGAKVARQGGDDHHAEGLQGAQAVRRERLDGARLRRVRRARACRKWSTPALPKCGSRPTMPSRCAAADHRRHRGHWCWQVPMS